MESERIKTGKLRQPMTAKCWVLALVGTMTFVMLMIAVINYTVDPFGYFHPSTENRDVYSFNGELNYRLVNFRYFEDHHQEYSGVIIGGSKGSFVDASYLDKISGERYCNLSTSHGNFYDYLAWTKWVADNTDIQYILLNLSTLEVQWYMPEERHEDTTGFFLPAELDPNKNRVVQFIQYLYRGGLEPSVQYLDGKINNSLRFYAYDSYVDDTPAEYADPMLAYQDWMPTLGLRLKSSLNGDYAKTSAIKQNLAALQEIREICEKSEIQLSVMIAPTSTLQYLRYECPAYWDYLKDMAEIVSYWDFSMPNMSNKNMFNFLTDTNHMYSEGVNHMLDQIYGVGSGDDFGAYVTAENIEEHIAERQRRYDALMEEYAETGTVWQGMYYDDGYLLSDMFYPIASNTGNTWMTKIPFKDYLNVTQHFYASFDHLDGISVFATGVPVNPEDFGDLELRVYDDTAKHTIFSKTVDLSQIRRDGYESFIHFDNLELTEGHWYSLIFSYEARGENDFFGLHYVDGEPTWNIYTELDGLPTGYEVKMSLYNSQTYGSYRQRDAVLQTDQMRGEGEGETQEITEQTRYTQTFTAGCDLLSYIQLKVSHRSDPEELATDEEYNVILELRGPDGALMSRKTIMGATLQNPAVGAYDVVFDGDLYMEQGETYEVTLYANKTAEQGLKLLTHGEEPDSVLYLNGAETGESLCYRIYGVSGEEIKDRMVNSIYG